MKREGKVLLCVALVAVAFMGGRYSAHISSVGDAVSEAEFREALASPDWAYRARTIGHYVTQLGPENLPEALAAVEARRRWLSQDELRLFMSAWAAFDPAGAFERSLTWPDHTRNKGAAAATYGWALYNPKAAHSAAMGVDDSSLRALLLDRIVAAWSHDGDRESLTLYLADLPDNPARDRLTSILIREIFGGGREAVVAWVEALPPAADSNFKSLAFTKAAGILAQDDPAYAAAFAQRNGDSTSRPPALAAVARRWASENPEDAAEWAQSLPEGTGRTAAIQSTFARWQKKNPTVAEQWLFAAEIGRELDPARFRVARRLTATSPFRALQFVQKIDDPSLRQKALVVTLRQWLQVDVQAANGWLSENPVDESTLAQVREKRRKSTQGQPPRSTIPAEE
ncbi:MAG: hypothetical protein OSB70_02305 [Myxococcota bacterium]|nr:hypothetical protein [Myxococcota bacterium]